MMSTIANVEILKDIFGEREILHHYSWANMPTDFGKQYWLVRQINGTSGFTCGSVEVAVRHWDGIIRVDWHPYKCSTRMVNLVGHDLIKLAGGNYGASGWEIDIDLADPDYIERVKANVGYILQVVDEYDTEREESGFKHHGI